MSRKTNDLGYSYDIATTVSTNTNINTNMNGSSDYSSINSNNETFSMLGVIVTIAMIITVVDIKESVF